MRTQRPASLSGRNRSHMLKVSLRRRRCLAVRPVLHLNSSPKTLSPSVSSLSLRVVSVFVFLSWNTFGKRTKLVEFVASVFSRSSLHCFREHPRKANRWSEDCFCLQSRDIFGSLMKTLKIPALLEDLVMFVAIDLQLEDVQMSDHN